ncbi:MAG: hypothetical protein PQJ46_13740, partial [Spirochaetales bacterium]|nr:hypothetical protein [Spirochaetales bacterium]
KYYKLTSIIIISIVLSSCMSVEHDIDILPVVNSIPTSASSSLFTYGSIFTNEDYTVVEEFKIPLSTSEPIRADEAFPIDINPALKEIIDKNGADAIVDLKFQLTYVDKTIFNLMHVEQYLAGAGALVAGGSVAFNALTEEEAFPTVPFVSGLSVAAVGVGANLLHYNLGKVHYKYEITGKAVKFLK